jgi:hypothetical protein
MTGVGSSGVSSCSRDGAGTTDFQPSDQHWTPVKVDARMKAGGENPFLDPRGWRLYITEREAAFRKTLDASPAAR